MKPMTFSVGPQKPARMATYNRQPQFMSPHHFWLGLIAGVVFGLLLGAGA